MMSHFTTWTLLLWVLGESRGSSTLRTSWDLHIRIASPRMHVYIKLSVKALWLTTGSTRLIPFFFTVRAPSVHFTKNRNLKMSMGFSKGFFLFVLFWLSASITFCSWLHACAMPPRQQATFVGIFFLLYPRTDSSPTEHTLCGQMLKCLQG